MFLDDALAAGRLGEQGLGLLDGLAAHLEDLAGLRRGAKLWPVPGQSFFLPRPPASPSTLLPVFCRASPAASNKGIARAASRLWESGRRRTGPGRRGMVSL
jgi:hypothetical protein